MSTGNGDPAITGCRPFAMFPSDFQDPQKNARALGLRKILSAPFRRSTKPKAGKASRFPCGPFDPDFCEDLPIIGSSESVSTETSTPGSDASFDEESLCMEIDGWKEYISGCRFQANWQSSWKGYIEACHQQDNNPVAHLGAAVKGELGWATDADILDFVAAGIIQATWRKYKYASRKELLESMRAAERNLKVSASFTDSHSSTWPASESGSVSSSTDSSSSSTSTESSQLGHVRARSPEPFVNINGESLRVLDMLDARPTQRRPGSIENNLQVASPLNATSDLKTIEKPRLARGASEPTRKANEPASCQRNLQPTPVGRLHRPKLTRRASDPSKVSSPKPPLSPGGLSLDVGYLSIMRPKKFDQQMKSSLMLPPITRLALSRSCSENSPLKPPSGPDHGHGNATMAHPLVMEKQKDEPNDSPPFKTTIERPSLGRVSSEGRESGICPLKSNRRQLSRHRSLDAHHNSLTSFEQGVKAAKKCGIPLHPKRLVRNTSSASLPEQRRKRESSTELTDPKILDQNKIDSGKKKRRMEDSGAASRIQSQWRKHKWATILRKELALAIVAEQEAAIAILVEQDVIEVTMGQPI